MKSKCVLLTLLLAVSSNLIATSANAQSKDPTDAAIFSIPQPPPFPDPTIVCSYGALNFPSVVSALRTGDDYTDYILWRSANVQTEKIEAITYFIAYLGYAKREINYISTCLNQQKVTVNPIASILEPNGSSPVTGDILSAADVMIAPDTDGEINAPVANLYPVLDGPAKAVTEANFTDFLQNRLQEMVGNYQKVYGYVYHPSALTTNGLGQTLKHPAF